MTREEEVKKVTDFHIGIKGDSKSNHLNLKKELLGVITEKVKGYVNSKWKHQNISSLSKKTNLSFNTVKSIFNEHLSYIESDTAFQILRYFFNSDEAMKLMSEPYPEWFRKYGQLKMESNYCNQTEHEFNWMNHYQLLHLFAEKNNGFCESWLFETYGRFYGMRLASKMVSSNILRKINGQYYAYIPNS